MTGMPQTTRSRQYYIDLAERYFAELDRKQDLEAVLDCLNEDALLVFMPGTHTQGRSALRDMFGKVFEDRATTLRHTNFVHCVDVEGERCSCQFDVEITRPGKAPEHYRNCNFFYFDSGRFQRVYVYITNANSEGS